MKFTLLFSLILSIAIMSALTIDDASGMKKSYQKDVTKNVERDVVTKKSIWSISESCLGTFSNVRTNMGEWAKQYTESPELVPFDIEKHDSENCIVWNYYYDRNNFYTKWNPHEHDNWIGIEINCETNEKVCENCKWTTYGKICNAYSSDENVTKYGLTISLETTNKSPHLNNNNELVWDPISKKWVEQSLLKVQKPIHPSNLLSETTESSSFNENAYIKQLKQEQEQLKQEQEQLKQRLLDVKKSTELSYYEKENIPKPSTPWWCFWC